MELQWPVFKKNLQTWDPAPSWPVITVSLKIKQSAVSEFGMYCCYEAESIL